MNCPNCTVTLVIAERHGVEIDYCPQCRGVWLDRGELDKILDRVPASAPMTAPPAAPYPTRPAEYRPQGDFDKNRDERERYEKHRYEKDEYRYKKKKREGFLGELFDF